MVHKALFLFVFIISSLVIFSCTEERKIAITEPPRGSMFPAGVEVSLKISGGSSVEVNDEPSARTLQLAPVEGLGFVKASIPGDPLFDVRSYIQGETIAKDAFNSGTTTITISPASLGDGPGTVSAIIAELLASEELEPFVENPLTMQYSTVLGNVTVTVTVTHVISPDVSISLYIEGDKLMLSGTLRQVDIDYTAQATGLSSSGSAYYETIDIEGELSVGVDGAQLLNATATTSDVVITDSGSLPAAGVEALGDLFDEEITQAVITAAGNATSAVFVHLIENLKPNLGLAFEKPVTSTARPESVTVAAQGLTALYETQVQAQTPSAAGDQHGILLRPVSVPAFSTELTATFGPRLINQYIFAVWDAGNFNGISFTKGALESMGMGELEFPYSNLDHVDIMTLLPPILEMRPEGPTLMIGGITMEMKIDASPDTTAWTAAEVPIKLTQSGSGLLVEVDSEREIVVYDVGFNKMSDLVDQGKVLKLMHAAVPGVVRHIFSELPALTISPIHFQRLDGSDGPVITPNITTVSPTTDGWELALYIVTTKK